MPASHELLTPLCRAGVVLVLGVIFALEPLTPLGFAHGTLYVLPVVLAGVAQDRRLVVAIGILAVLAIAVGAAIAAPAHPNFPEIYIVGNRIGSVLAVIATSALAYAMLGRVVDAHTARRTAEDAHAAVAARDDLLHMAGEVARFGGWSVRLADGHLSWSPEVARLFDQPAGVPALSLEQAFDAYTPSCRERVRAVFEACAERGTPFDEEAELAHADGSTVWVRTMGHAVRDGQGRIVEVRGAFQDLSAVKAAEQSLERVRAHFQRLADAMPIVVWTADPDGVVDYHNRALLDYAGPGDPAWQPAERWLHLLHPDDREHTLAIWDVAVRSGEPYRVEFRLRCVDGTHHWFLTRATAERDAAGNIVKWYGSSADIDEQKQLEAEARALAARLTRTLDSITDGFITFDTDWRITFVNRQAEGLLGRSAETLIGQDLWTTFPEAVGTRFETEYRAALASGRTTRFDARFAPLELYADISVYPSPEGLAVYFRDISAERAAHARLQLLQNAVARLSDIVVIAAVDKPDQVPRIVFINDAFARITGYPREEVIGQPYGFMLDEAADPAARARLTAALHAWQPVRAELPCRTHGGREIWLEIDLVPLAADSDRYTHWVGVERDISERVQLEGNLRQSQRLEALGQLTGGIAHDFNNLLTVILGNAEVLSDGLKPGSEYHQLAEMILGAALRGSELTARLLAFARRQALDPQAVDINRLIVNLEPLLRRTLGEHVEIELVRGAGLWPALIDAGQLEDAVLNLCLNARDAMPGGGRLTIETANTRLDRDYAARHPSVEAGQYVLVAVSDTGTGIAPEDLERVFEPFFSTKEKGKGTGLGLSMVYGFIKQSGGHVNIYSESGHGTTLRMYLPRAYGAAATQEAETAEQRSVGGREKVLLVEDDELVRRYAARELAALGYEVLEAANGPRALEVFTAHPDIDLLFTDVVMPGGLSGRELADRVRVSRPHLRVLFTSGYTENAIVHHGRLDPGVHLLAKPYRRAELARAVRLALNGDGSEA